MANGEEKSNDLYAVLGLHKECTETEMRNAYKKLALRWHPDRCSARGNSKFVEEAKKKFQAIQQAYSVLSDANKRFLYDVGIYDSDDDDQNENGEESFEELQEFFEEMFQGDVEALGSSFQNNSSCSTSSSSYASYRDSSNLNKRNSSEITSGKTNAEGSSSFDAHFQSFCFGVEHQQNFTKGKAVRGGIPGGAGGSQSDIKKQKLSSSCNLSFYDHSSISASRCTS